MKPLCCAALLTFALLAGCESDNVRRAKAYAIEGVRDPDSVMWRNITKGEDGAVCGEYNAKNAYGGYVGYRSFYVGSGFRDRQPDEEKRLKPYWELLTHYCPSAIYW